MQSNTTKLNPIYLDPVKVGASLKEVGVDYQEIESREVETRWFRDQDSETDVFVWISKDKKMIKQQVSLMGLLTEWNILDGVRTGMIMESEMNNHDVMENGLTEGDVLSEAIHFDKKPQQRTLEMAISILTNMTCVEPDLMEKMLKNFNQGMSLQNPFLEFRLPGRAAHSLPRDNIWVKIKRFILSCFTK